MKKYLAVLLVIVLMISVIACSPQEEGEDPSSYEIAMVSDTSSIEDGSFNEAVWDGIEDFVEKKPISYKYYLTTEDTTEAYLRAVSEAVEGGAKIIIAAGSAFDHAVYKAQSEHPQISFVLVDGQPQDGEKGTVEIRKNTVAITFAEEQAGYLAGYAAVKEGYKNLGFIGGKEQPPVRRFGYGFLQGADGAAKENGMSGIKVRYYYANTFTEDQDLERTAAEWYGDGTEVIFSCAGGAGNSVMRAAEQAKGKIIGVDLDQSRVSKTVIVSAVKNISAAVSDVLWGVYGDDEFAGGQHVNLNAANGGIGLSIDSSTMQNFSQSDYEKILKQLADGKAAVRAEGIKGLQSLETERVKIDFGK